VTVADYATGLGGWICAERRVLDIKQAELAEAMDVTVSTVSNWETGKALLSALSHARLRAYFRQQRKARGMAEEVLA
jgi:DNA-binding transcriptional regulator YiaG